MFTTLQHNTEITLSVMPLFVKKKGDNSKIINRLILKTVRLAKFHGGCYISVLKLSRIILYYQEFSNRNEVC